MENTSGCEETLPVGLRTNRKHIQTHKASDVQALLLWGRGSKVTQRVNTDKPYKAPASGLAFTLHAFNKHLLYRYKDLIDLY